MSTEHEHDDVLLFADEDDELIFAEEEEQAPSQTASATWKVLLVDDEAEIHNVTKLTLSDFQFQGQPIEFLHAYTGQEACQIMQERDDVGLILLDVVMEKDQAGFEVVQRVRSELGNRFVRILLRTGQPGVAPERQSIEQYDIDGYLPKAELTSHRLFVAARTALKAYSELIALERHREVLSLLHASAVQLHAYDPLDSTLWNLLQTALAIAPAPLALLDLQSYDEEEEWQHSFLHLHSDPNYGDPEYIQQYAEALRQNPQLRGMQHADAIEGGYLIPLRLHRDLGYGWIFLLGATPDQLTGQALRMLGAHAANGLYSIVSQSILQARDKPLYDTLDI